MEIKKVRFAYRKVINQKTDSLFEKYIFTTTQQAYLKCEPQFNSERKPLSFVDLLRLNPKAAELHTLLSHSVVEMMNQLQNNIYYIPDVLGRSHLKFEAYNLDIVNANIADSSKHAIGITFITPIVTLVYMDLNKYVISYNNPIDNQCQTLTFRNSEDLSIIFASW